MVPNIDGEFEVFVGGKCIYLSLTSFTPMTYLIGSLDFVEYKDAIVTVDPIKVVSSISSTVFSKIHAATRSAKNADS